VRAGGEGGVGTKKVRRKKKDNLARIYLDVLLSFGLVVCSDDCKLCGAVPYNT
jgi:hypothetical protein